MPKRIPNHKRIPTHIAEEILASERDVSEALIGSDLAYNAQKPVSAVLFEESNLTVTLREDGCLWVVTRTDRGERISSQVTRIQNIAGYPDEQFSIGEDDHIIWYSRKPAIDYERITLLLSQE